jgi:hypothetical protein
MRVATAVGLLSFVATGLACGRPVGGDGADVDADSAIVGCGNGVVDEGEECDDAHPVAGLACRQCLVTDILVNTYVSGAQIFPDVAVTADGRIVAVWSSSEQDGDGFGVYGQRIDAAGAFNRETASNQWLSTVACTPDGRCVIVWQGEHVAEGDLSSVFAQRYDATGQPIGLQPW